jgi:hypothetical protein
MVALLRPSLMAAKLGQILGAKPGTRRTDCDLVSAPVSVDVRPLVVQLATVD